jgi:putative LysE/RhtB family amino acid efflux pump
MLMSILLAVAVGFAVSFFTLGPTTIMAIRRMCTHGFTASMMIGLGSALADGMYAAIPAFGLRGLSEHLETYRLYVELGGAFILIAFGLFFVFWRKEVEPHKATPKENAGSFGTGFLLNAINPGNVFAFTFFFALFGVLPSGMTLGDSTGITLGVLVGSAMAWGLKVWLIYLIGKERLNEDNVNTVTRVMGLISVAAGLGLGFYALFT